MALQRIAAHSRKQSWRAAEIRVLTIHTMTNQQTPPATTSSSIADSAPWWKHLNRYHWFVFAMASLAWMFDCLDQQLFILARNFAMEGLLPPGMNVGKYGTYATAIFVA